ncbi:hypothetical protein fugu_006441 [Takifugu bimaculatus]|uniref:Uncharacterized protein n=1 Tax=Takifugu bimaculatus TaxID=433685 RepID=A0A4Z2BAZ2_9TELE|nr:hypothetical protein fugu_006441 [Takifugu bimaculatus]
MSGFKGKSEASLPGCWIVEPVPRGPEATAAITCSNNLSIDGRGSAESLGVLNLSPSGDNIGPNNPPRRHVRPAFKPVLASVVRAIVEDRRNDELTDRRSSSTVSVGAARVFVYVVPVSRKGIRDVVPEHTSQSLLRVQPIAENTGNTYLSHSSTRGSTPANTADRL